MLHDILLALGGHPGDLIQLSNPTTTNSTFPPLLSYTLISASLPHLHPTIESQQITSLMQIGAIYLSLRLYTESILNSAPNGILSQQYNDSAMHRSNTSSLYKKSICTAIQNILSTYLQHLTKLEQRLLRNPILSLSYLRSELRDYEVVLMHLMRFCQYMESKDLSGGALLDELEERVRTGVPIVKRAFEKLLEVCYSLLIRNLMSWMVYGHLNAAFEEFFIESDANGPMSQTQSQRDILSRRLMQQNLKAWSTQYSVKHDMLPKRISLKLAEKILFIGKAIKILQEEDQGTRGANAANDSSIHNTPRQQQPQQSATPNSKPQNFLTFSKSIPQKQLYKYSEALEKHEHTGLRNMVAFEYTINAIRASVAKYLWNLIVVDSDFMGQLNALKDYYLLCKGDFFHVFMEEACTLMFSPPSKNASNDIRLLFQDAVKKSSAESDPMAQNFEIVFQKPSSFSRSRSTLSDQDADGRALPPEILAKNIFETWITALRVDCTVKWPLHLLFHKKVLDRYNALFQFLFAMRRLQYNLQASWVPLLKQKRFSSLHELQMHFHRVRSKISFIIDNMLYYLQVDVIDANFQRLSATIDTLQDFDSVRRAHNNYLASITAQCFLNSKEVKEAIRKLTELTVKYTLIVLSDLKELHQGVGIEMEQDASGIMSNELIEKRAQLQARILQLEHQWDQQSNALFQILSNVKLSSPHLTQLLLRLDFNRYFSAAGDSTQQNGVRGQGNARQRRADDDAMEDD